MNYLTRLSNFWFRPMAPERLAIIRIATGLFALWYMCTRYGMLVRIASSDPGLYSPVGIVTLFQSPMPAAVFQALLLLTMGLCAAYIAGWKFRFTGPAFALTFLLLMCYRNSWSMIYHSRNILVLHIIVIGFTAAADALAWRSVKAQPSRGKHWQYGWPVMLLSLTTVIAYFLAGLAKVYSELSWSWITGQSMRSQVAVDAIRKNMLGSSGSALFEWLYAHTELFLVMGILAFVIELGAPLALINRKVSMAWALLACSMHWGIYFIMDITFHYQLIGFVFLSFFPLEQFWQKLRALVIAAGQGKEDPLPQQGIARFVLFDGVCNFCNASVRFIARNDPQGKFKFASIQSAEGQALLNARQAPTDLSTIALIEKDAVYTHSTAVLRIAGHLKFPWRLAYAALIVPVPLRNTIYRYVAANRYRWFGKQDHCELPGPALAGRLL